MLEWAVTVSMEVIVDGVLTRPWGRRKALLPVMVIWDGLDLRVWMSIPDMERMDSCEVDRRSVGWKGDIQF